MKLMQHTKTSSWKASQKPGEPIEQFIQDLYHITDDYEYGALKGQLIRDHIVVGAVRLQSKADLTLADAVQQASQAEAWKQDRVLIRGNKTVTANLDYVKAKPQKKSRGRMRWLPGSNKPCGWCGGIRHNHEKCPAKDAICNKCKKRGNFAQACRRSTR